MESRQRAATVWTSIAVAALAVALGAASLAPAATPPATDAVKPAALDLKYDVYYSLLRLMTIESRSEVAPDVYSLESRMETVGMISVLFPWTYRSEVHGRITDQRLQPDVFSSHSEIRDRVQQVNLRYTGADGPQVDEITPFDANVLGEDYTRDEVPADMRSGTIDPLTELASVSQQVARGEGCAGTRHVFDGVRRYDVIYEDLGETELESSRYDEYAGRSRQCRSRVEPIAGFWRPKEEKADLITSITAWMMPPVPGAAPVPVRIEVQGTRGTLTIHLTKASVASS